MNKFVFISCAILSLVCSAEFCFAYSYGTQPRKEYYDEWGRLQGYSQLDFSGNQTNHYDEWGRLQGCAKTDSFSNEVRHYDEWGRLQGTTKLR